MKKTLLLATALTASLAALAQNPIVPVESQAGMIWDSYIPPVFSDAPYLVVGETDENYNVSYKILNHNLQLVRTISGNDVSGMYTYNFDDDFMTGEPGRVRFTQTLFNNDSRFEYISAIRDGNGKYIRHDVIADDGTVVATFGDYAGKPTNEGLGIRLLKIANTLYLQVEGEGYDEDYQSSSFYEWYRIDRQTQSISRVEGLPFNVFPTVADRESTITVQFEDGATATELQVLDAQGRTVQRIPVAPGQQEVKVSTRGLRSGVGFIGDRRGGAAKIIVR